MNGIKPHRFAEKMRLTLPEIENLFSEYLPADFLKKYGLMGIQDTLKNIHYPQNIDKLGQAKHRIFFDKLLRVQLHSLLTRKEYQD
jgi:ATP-dependent DNA helicase RecG